MSNESRINQINAKISELIKEAQDANNLDERVSINDQLLSLVKEWEKLTGQKRPGAQSIIGYN